MLDLGVPAYLINSTLLGVMAQRLVRTLCPHCKAPGEPPDDETWRAITSPWRADKPAQVMAPVGCLECRMTGYRGRIGLYEVMLMTPAIRKLVTSAADDTKVREQAYKDGMKPLRVSGAMKVAAGWTSAEEVLKVAPLDCPRVFLSIKAKQKKTAVYNSACRIAWGLHASRPFETSFALDGSWGRSRVCSTSSNSTPLHRNL